MGKRLTEIDNPYRQKPSLRKRPKNVKPKKLNAGRERAVVNWLVVLAVCTALIKLVAYLHDRRESRRKPVKEVYGVQVPVEYSVFGVDVSAYQGTIYWNRINKETEAGPRLEFVFVKATEGENHKDPFLKQNLNGALNHVNRVGVYHYFKAGKDPIRQAEWFVKNCSPRCELRYVADIEERGGASQVDFEKNVAAFLLKVHALTGKKPLVYSGIKFYNKHLRECTRGYPLWLAHYNSDDGAVSGTASWEFWQFSDRGRFPGCRRPVDLDVFRGDTLLLNEVWEDRIVEGK